MRRAVVSLTIFACLLATAACANSTAPPVSRAAKAAPHGASNTRYILASGDTPPEGCLDVGNGYWECDESALALPESPTAPAIAPDSSVTSPDSSVTIPDALAIIPANSGY